MSTDPTPLQERLARVIYGEDPKWGYIQAGDHHGVAWETLPEPIQHDMLGMAADVLPIIRKAQADAWDEACQAFAWCRDNGPIEDALPYVAEHNPYRTEESRA